MTPGDRVVTLPAPGEVGAETGTVYAVHGPPGPIRVVVHLDDGTYCDYPLFRLTPGDAGADGPWQVVTPNGYVGRMSVTGPLTDTCVRAWGACYETRDDADAVASDFPGARVVPMERRGEGA